MRPDDDEVLAADLFLFRAAMARLALTPAACASVGYAEASGRPAPPPPPAVWAKPSLPAAEEAQGAMLAARACGEAPRKLMVGATGGAFGAPDPFAPTPRGVAGFRLGAMLAAMATAKRDDEAARARGARRRRAGGTHV